MAGIMELGNNLIIGAASKRENGVTTYYPNIELLYGPYDSTTAAYTALQDTYGALVVGRVVGVYNADKTKITEYWLSGGTAKANLVEKMPAAGGKIDAVKVNGTALSISSTDKSVNIPLGSSSAPGVVKQPIIAFGGVNADGEFSKYPVKIDSSGQMYACVPLAGNGNFIDDSYAGVISRAYFNKFNRAASKVDQGAEFSASTKYLAGDVVVKNSLTYQFTKEHPAGAWIGTEGTNADVVLLNDFKTIKQECLDAVADVLSDLNDYIDSIIH